MERLGAQLPSGKGKPVPASNPGKHPNAQPPLLFPVLAIIGIALFASWLSWPGLVTHDGLFILREAVQGRYTTYHPILNALLLRVAAVPFDSLAPYTLLQVALCTTLFVRSLHLVAGPAMRSWRAWLTVALWALAVPTVLYLGIVWKDVPTAYCIAFIAALGYRLRTSPTLQVRSLDAALLGIGVFLCVGLRHGMAFNLVLVPLLLGFRRVLADRRLWAPIALAAVGYAALFGVSHSRIVANDEAHFLELQISATSQPLLGIVSNKNGYTSDDYGYDDALARHVFGNRYAAEYTPDYFRNSIVLKDAGALREAYAAILRRTPRLCALNASLCLSGRVQMMLGTLQPSTRFGGMTFYDLGAMAGCESVYGMGPDQCALLARFESGEKPARAVQAIRWMSSSFVDQRGPLSNLVVWNLIPALLVFMAILLLSAPSEPLWPVAGFVIIQCVLPFATAMANDYRYYYFLYPAFALFAPVALQKATSAARWSHPNRGPSQSAGGREVGDA
jgi:hypothetical protein